MSNPTTTHPLNGKWDLYYHLPNDSSWNLSSYKTIMKDISSVEDVVSLNKSIHESIIKNTMLFVMKSGITPMWEDEKNRNGGCFSFKVLNKQVNNIWKQLFCALCGETLCVDKKHNEFINGITISPKKHFCIIKVWLSTLELQDPDCLITIPDLHKQGCIFKKHEPES